MIKTLHVTSVIASGGFFLLRFVWMLQGSALLQRRWVKIAPHIIDTVLLVSAIVLAVQLAQYPFVQGWLTAKVLALLAYIVLGTLALKRAPTRALRIACGGLALLVFAYIVAVAITRLVQPWLLLG